jgi:hypothetical protein
MIKITAALVTLLCLTGAAFAGDVCDKPSNKLSPNQIFACKDEHDAAVAPHPAATPTQQQVLGEAPEETERKLKLRHPVPGEATIVSPYREVPIR